MTRSRRRKLLIAGLLVVAGIVAYNLTELSLTVAKMLDRGAAFDWWAGPVNRSTIQIGSIPADVYSGSHSGMTLLFVHGVNETGKDSPVIRPVAEAFAGSGFKVVIPDFVRLKRQNVTPADVDDMVVIIQSFDGDAGIVCASYGCGPALIAATRPEVRDRIRFVGTYGAYFDLKETLRFIVTGPPSSMAYSKWMYLAGNIDLIESTEDRQRLVAIGVERRDRPREQWKLDGSNLQPDARAMLALFESSTNGEFDQRLKNIPLLEDRIEKLSPSRHLAGMRARLIVVHLGSDGAIPASESLHLVEAAKAKGIPARLTLLNAQGHTRPEWPRPGIRTLFGFYLPEGWKFVRALREVLSFA